MLPTHILSGSYPEGFFTKIMYAFLASTRFQMDSCSVAWHTFMYSSE